MNDKQFTEILNKLDLLIQLLALNLVSEKKQQNQIMLLSKVGMQPKEIAKLLDTTPNTVRDKLYVELVSLNKALVDIRGLMQHSLAVQLYCAGATQDEITKNLRIGKGKVNKMVKGVKLTKDRLEKG